MSTDDCGQTASFDIDAAWRLHPQVSIRPERFGALLYHFGTRRLSFLKNLTLLDIVRSLETQRSARTACDASGVAASELPAYAKALASLAASSTICAWTPREHATRERPTKPLAALALRKDPA